MLDGVSSHCWTESFLAWRGGISFGTLSSTWAEEARRPLILGLDLTPTTARLNLYLSLRKFTRCVRFRGPSHSTSSVIAVAVAGGGGVIPAVQLKDAKLSAIYLSTFCATSTFTMGGFALLYGSFSTWLAGGEQSSHRQQQEGRRSSARSRVFLVEAGSAMLSIAVGIIWLVLLSMGELEEVFS